MAEVEIKTVSKEVVTLVDETVYQLTLSKEEMVGLGNLFYYGTSGGALRVLGLFDLSRQSQCYADGTAEFTSFAKVKA